MVAVLAAAATREPYLAIVSVPLVVFFVLARLTSHAPHVDLEVERWSNEERLYEDDPRSYSLMVRNRGSKLDMVEAVDLLPGGVKVTAGANRAYASLAKGEEVEIRYDAACPSFGTFSVGPVRVRSTDSFGLFAEEKTLEERAALVVFPKLQLMEHLELGLRLAKHWPGEIMSRRTGTGMEFYSIRPYAPEDMPRNVNWRATARSEGLQTNQYMKELGGEVMVVVDARASTEVGRPGRTVLKYSIEAAAAVSYGLLRDRVGLLAVGETLVKVQPGFGRRHFDRILYSLMEVRAGSMWEMKHLPQYLRLLYPKVNQLVVVSPLTDRGVFSSLVELASDGYAMTLLSPSPFELEKETLKGGRVEEAAERLARARGGASWRALSRHVTVVDWDVRVPLSQALSEGVLAWRRRQGR